MRNKKSLIVSTILLYFTIGSTYAADETLVPIENAIEETSAFYGQVTNLSQKHSSFRSPYSGVNSLDARGRTEETSDITLYAGVRPWPGAQLWLNPEIDQGFGLSNTVGVAGFPSGEAYKVGANRPYLRLPRAFLRQLIPLGGETQKIDSAANQLGGSANDNNVTLTVGKFSVTDIFDTNSYSHDPRVDFMNWSLIDSGAIDYAADAWGFTYGAAVEWNENCWSLRAGAFELSSVPNGKIVRPDFSQHSFVTEFEGRYQWQGHPGKVKLLAILNRARMGSYRNAVDLSGANNPPDIALVRRTASRAGIALNIEQALQKDLGIFLRMSANDGSKEAYEFTEINRSLAAGLSLKGERWNRHEDSFGVAIVSNYLSGAAQQYFRAGGVGILIDDGALRYGPEQIAETYYSVKIASGLAATMDYQRINNPAYNRDRGPVSVYALRLHAEF